MIIPVNLDVRKKEMLPIVEVTAVCNKDISVWFYIPLQIIDKGVKAGGRLLAEEPKGKLQPNTVFFSLIFESEQKCFEFLKTLKHG